jgi:hypothetical protein
MWTRWWTSGFHKMLGSSRVAAQLEASQEGLCSMSEWVIDIRHLYVKLVNNNNTVYIKTKWLSVEFSMGMNGHYTSLRSNYLHCLVFMQDYWLSCRRTEVCYALPQLPVVWHTDQVLWGSSNWFTTHQKSAKTWKRHPEPTGMEFIPLRGLRTHAQ